MSVLPSGTDTGISGTSTHGSGISASACTRTSSSGTTGIFFIVCIIANLQWPRPLCPQLSAFFAQAIRS